MTDKRLDDIFSRLIRTRDTIKKGYGNCIICNATLSYEAGQCGHFMKRANRGTRWHPMNAFLICLNCNTEDDHDKFEKKLIEKFSQEYVDTIKRLARKDVKLTNWEKKELCDYIKQELECLTKF